MEKYLKDNLSFLSDIDLDSLNDNIIYQVTALNSEHYNRTQKEIYYQLNKLYEKMRLLEDVNAYLHEKMQSKISESSAICESLLNEIQESRDAIKETTYHNIYVDMHPTGTTTDRDGVTLPSAIIYNNEVVTRFSTKRNVPYVSEVKTNKTVYKNNIGALEQNKAYRSYYIMDQNYKDGITEKITFVFGAPTPINKIRAKTSGAKAFNFQLHNAKDIFNIKDLSWSDPIEADSASFDINTQIYKEKIYLCDASRMAPDALAILDNEIYKEIIGESNMTQSEIDTLLGVSAFKADYQKYLEAAEDWKKRREAVAEQNKANGHTDSVPDYTIEKLPSSLGANEPSADGKIRNQTIDTSAILPTRQILEKDGASERIVYIYEHVDKIYPSYERYRFDFNDPSHERYYNNLNSSGGEINE